MNQKYEDTITDPGCLRMRNASGAIDDARPLVSFLYLLLRDHLHLGDVEEIVDRATKGAGMFTNGWLAQYAQDIANRLEPHGRGIIDHVAIDAAARLQVAMWLPASCAQCGIEYDGVDDFMVRKVRAGRSFMEDPTDSFVDDACWNAYTAALGSVVT